jgi:alpha-tubulin suppressor-like RCC1 family protein
VTDIRWPIALASGQSGTQSFHDPVTPAVSRFYQIEKVSVLTPLDTDADGLDDAWELSRRPPAAVMNGQDAEDDLTGNGVADRLDYLRERLSSGSRAGRSAIAASASHGVALKTDGTMWGWGNNSFGQLGMGTVGLVGRPAQFGSQTNWVDVEAGGACSFAWDNAGHLWSWGENKSGQLGHGTWANTDVPALMDPVGSWSALSASINHVLAVKSDGSLWTWGGDFRGAVGTGTRIGPALPAEVNGDRDWIAISAGSDHTLAVKSDGTLWAWGDNASGQCGQSATWAAAPVLGDHWGLP